MLAATRVVASYILLLHVLLYRYSLMRSDEKHIIFYSAVAIDSDRFQINSVGNRHSKLSFTKSIINYLIGDSNQAVSMQLTDRLGSLCIAS